MQVRLWAYWGTADQNGAPGDVLAVTPEQAAQICAGGFGEEVGAVTTATPAAPERAVGRRQRKRA